VPVELLGDGAQLDNEVSRKVLRLDFTPFFPPEAEQSGLIVAHEMIRASEPPMKLPRFPAFNCFIIRDSLALW